VKLAEQIKRHLAILEALVLIAVALLIAMTVSYWVGGR